MAEEYQRNGDNIPLSYKKAYDRMELYSEAAEKKMKQSSEDAKEDLVDDADKIGDAHKKNAESTSRNWGAAFSALGGIATTGVKILAAGTGVAITGITALGTAATNTYADYEQLVGGIETLFGTGGQSMVDFAIANKKSVLEVKQEYNSLMAAQNTALRYAGDAYKTAGLSANEYMETITGFAASLKQSTDTELEAAQAGNQAVIDMADNANKMGTSMELIQNAYQGFAKQNYTMLDNLKLGYGGTKEEMARLLEDAEKLSGVEYDMSNLADVYEAIHVVQTELGITGTTAKEASTTISGSMNMMKASWSNLLVGVADDSQDFDALVDDFVSSVVTVAENMLPRIETALGGAGNLIESLLPVVVEKIPGIINDILPDLMQSGIDMISSLVSGLEENLPEILSAGGQILASLAEGIITVLPMLASIAYEMVMSLVNGVIENADTFLQQGSELLLQFITGIAEKISELMSTWIEMIVSLAMALTEPDTLGNIISAGIELLIALIDGLLEALPKLMEAAPVIITQLVAAIIQNAPKLLSAAITILGKLAQFLFMNVETLLTAVPKLFNSLVDKFKSMDWGEIGQDIIDGIWGGLEAGWSWLVDKVKGLASALFGEATEELEGQGTSGNHSGGGGSRSYAGSSNSSTSKTYSGITNGVNASAGVVRANTSYADQQDAQANIVVVSKTYLEGDAKGVFKIVRTENDKEIKATGFNPLNPQGG